ncbi:MAG TPA: MFS transporter [Ktedonobacteraceae bacterium]|nr:MFS transporter [Ktedonobacteraceae bacterium]
MASEQAQVPAPVPRAARLAVAVHFFLTGVTFASWAVRIPAVQAKLGLNPGELGLALLGTAAGELVSMNLAGYLTARFGSRSLTIIASVCLSVMLPILALAPSLPVLVASLVLFGASFGSVNVAMNTQGVAVERRYGHSIFSSFHACYSIGGLTGSLVGGLVAARDIAPLPHFFGIAFLAIVLALSLARFLLPAHADAQGAGVAFARVTPPLLALGFVAFCALLGEGAMADWSAVYLHTTLGASAGLAAAGYAAFSVVMAVGRGLGDRLTNHLGPGMMVQLGGLVAATGLTLALVVNWVPLALAGFGLVGAGFAVIFPLTLSAAGRTSKEVSGTAIATVALCGYIGFLVGPAVIGFGANVLNLRVSLGIVVLLSLCAAACARVVGNGKQARAEDQPASRVDPLVQNRALFSEEDGHNL